MGKIKYYKKLEKDNKDLKRDNRDLRKLLKHLTKKNDGLSKDVIHSYMVMHRCCEYFDGVAKSEIKLQAELDECRQIKETKINETDNHKAMIIELKKKNKELEDENDSLQGTPYASDNSDI